MAAITRTGVSSPARGDLVASDTLSGLAGEPIAAGQGFQVTGELRGHPQMMKATTRVDGVCAADAATGESLTGLLVGQRIRIGKSGQNAGQLKPGTIYYLDAANPGEWSDTANPGTGLKVLALTGGRVLILS